MNIKTTTLTILLCLGILSNVYSQPERKKSIVVLPFSFRNSAAIQSQVNPFFSIFETKLFAAKKYILIEQKLVGLIGKIQNTSIFDKDSDTDTAVIGKFLNIDYIVMGDVLNNRTLIIKIIDTKRKEVIFTRIYDINNNVLPVIDTASKDIIAKIDGYSFRSFNIYAKYSYFIPLGNLAEIIANGYGGGAGFACELPWAANLLAGAEVQYFNIDGKTEVTHHSTLVPVTAFIKYKFELHPFYITPRLFAGMSYNSLYFFKDTSIDENYSVRSSYDPTCGIGLDAGFSLHYLISFFISLDYGMFYYENRDNRFCTLSFGFNANF